MGKTRITTMSLDKETIDALDDLRGRLGCSRSEVVRLFAQASRNAPLEFTAILKQLKGGGH